MTKRKRKCADYRVTVAARLTHADASGLDALCRETGITRSELLRLAITEFSRRHAGQHMGA
jgi:hypothetical protein